jgi:hypothetical protein
MAGTDHLFDVRYEIEDFIERKIRGLLEDPMNELQDPNWVQAAILFEQTVIPCERYRLNIMRDLAKDILEKAAQNENRVIYQEIPGMYNERVVDPSLIDLNKLPDDMRLIQYDYIIVNIKKWMENFQLNK